MFTFKNKKAIYGIITGAFLLFTSTSLAAQSPDEIKPSQPEDVPDIGLQTLTVGPDMDCDFSALQPAIAAANEEDTIRLMDGGGYTGAAYDIVAKAVTIRGGYPDCNFASSPNGRTSLNANGNGEVFDIFYTGTSDDPFKQVNLENLKIQGGGGADGAGVLVEGNPGRLQVNLRNVEISQNSRTGDTGHGAGLRVIVRADGFTTFNFVTVDNDSVIGNNTAGGDGGGVYCQSSYTAPLLQTTLLMGTTLVFNNTAGGDGGGIAISGCENVVLHNGGDFVGILPAGGIVNNTASGTAAGSFGRGGGIYVESGGEVFLRAAQVNGFGDPDKAALLLGNQASRGGGAAAFGMGSSLIIEDAYIVNNNASSQGGALDVSGQASLTVRRSASGRACMPQVSGGGTLVRPPCSVIEDNDSFDGGILKVSIDGQAEINRTIVRNNTSNTELIDVQNAAGPTTANVRIEGSLFTGNQGASLFNAANDTQIDVFYSTFASNDVNEIAISLAASGSSAAIEFYSSILINDNDLANPAGSGTISIGAHCVIGNAAPGNTGFTSTTAYSQVDPQFMAPGSSNYHLSNTSPAIDYCDGTHPPLLPDLDGNPRGVAWAGPAPDPAPNPLGGDYDLGAYEAILEFFFEDGFESP